MIENMIVSRTVTLRGTQTAIDQAVAHLNARDDVSITKTPRGRKPGVKTGHRPGSLPSWLEHSDIGDHCWTEQPAQQVASTVLRTSAQVTTEKWCCVHAGTERLTVLTKVTKVGKSGQVTLNHDRTRESDIL